MSMTIKINFLVVKLTRYDAIYKKRKDVHQFSIYLFVLADLAFFYFYRASWVVFGPQ